MRAIVYSENGTSDVLRLVERDVPEPGAGQVRVRLAVSGVNPTDWKSRAGLTRSASGSEVVPQLDGAGTVDAVGAGVEGVAVGQRVWVFMARPDGTAQEHVVLPAWQVAPLPDGVSFDVGASLGVPALTAHRALAVGEDTPARLAPGAFAGATVLVTGGAGAVGHAAIQLARWAGATVLTTVSGPEKAALATAAGAHHTVNYRSDDATAAIRDLAPDGVDLVVDVALSANIGLDLAVVRPRATIASYADDGGAPVALDVRQNMTVNARYQFVLLYTVGQQALEDGAADISAALADDALPVGEEHGLPVTRFPLADTAAAHDAVESGMVGKVLVDVSG